MSRLNPRNITLAALTLVALAVFFLLPRFITEPVVTITPEQAPPQPMAVTPSKAAEKSHFRDKAQETLGAVFTLREALTGLSVEEWAGDRFSAAEKQVAEGDELYTLGEYQQALDLYQQALDQLEALDSEATRLREEALVQAPEAIESGNRELAGELLARLGYLAKDDPVVPALQARADVMPQVAEAMGLGLDARQVGQWPEAASHFEKVLALDPQHEGAKSLLQEARAQQREDGFAALMGSGYSALERGDFSAAEQAFNRAAEADPASDEVSQARELLANRRALVNVNDKLAHAQQAEAAEEWGRAVDLYEALAREDAALTEPRVRLIPARVRAELDDRLESLVSDPLRLSRSDVAARANQALADAGGIAKPGPRLTSQISRLETLLARASEPVEVRFASDGLTEVTLYRVEKMGVFDSRTVTLKPGKYTAAGTRKGYRDVVVEFTVTGEPEAPVVDVRCTEPI